MVKEKYINKVREISINVVKTQVESIRRKDIQKTGLRIYKDGYIGCSGAIGKYDEAELEKKAMGSLKNKISYAYEPEGNLTIKEDFSHNIIKEEELLNEFEELLSILRKEQPNFDFYNKLNLLEQEIRLFNNKGLDLYYKDKYITLGLIFKEKSSIHIMDGLVGYMGRKYDKDLVLKDINRVCNAFLNKVELPNKKRIPVVFDSYERLPFMKLLQELNGNNFGSNSSLLSDKMGKKVFNDSFTLYQTNNPEYWPLPFFDAEGIVNKNYRYDLIEKGIIVSPYTDKRTAHKYNFPLTGSAKAEYDGVPTLGEPILQIEESKKTAKELLGGEMGIYVAIAFGGDFTPEGNFSTPVQLAFLFDGENFIGKLPELNISSNLFDMFGNSFIGVSKDFVSPLSKSRYLIIELEVSEL